MTGATTPYVETLICNRFLELSTETLVKLLTLPRLKVLHLFLNGYGDQTTPGALGNLQDDLIKHLKNLRWPSVYLEGIPVAELDQARDASFSKMELHYRYPQRLLTTENLQSCSILDFDRNLTEFVAEQPDLADQLGIFVNLNYPFLQEVTFLDHFPIPNIIVQNPFTHLARIAPDLQQTIC